MYNIIYTYTIYNKSLLKKIKKVFQLYNLSRETIEKGNYNPYRYGYTFIWISAVEYCLASM